MANTENLNLKKSEQTDFYNVEDFNENFQKIDDFAGRKDNPHGVTAEQVGAWKIDTDGMVTNITNLNDLYYSGFFRCTSAFTNTPVTPTGGDIVIVFPWDANTVLQIYSSSVDYTLWCRKSYFGGENIRLWKDWQKIALSGEFLPIIGGTLTGYLGLKDGYGTVDADENHTNITAYPTKGDTSNRRGILIFNHKGEPTRGNAIQFRDVINGIPKDYILFGEHNLQNPARIQTGSYSGTGAYNSVGSSNTLTFDFTPKLVCITTNYSVGMLIMIYGSPQAQYIVDSNSNTNYTNTLNWGDNSVSWFCNSSAQYQMNAQNQKYYWVAIG